MSYIGQSSKKRHKMANFSHVIFYIKDISRAISFYKDAFDIQLKYIHESNQYAELNTGATTIAFASETLGSSNLPEGYIPHDITKLPLASEICFTVSDVQKSYKRAIAVGGISVVSPEIKAWGQTVAYIRDPNGLLVEIASPMS